MTSHRLSPLAPHPLMPDPLTPHCPTPGRFYQDDNDNLRGYPLQVDKATGLPPHVLLVEITRAPAEEGSDADDVRASARVYKRRLLRVREEWSEEAREVRARNSRSCRDLTRRSTSLLLMAALLISPLDVVRSPARAAVARRTRACTMWTGPGPAPCLRRGSSTVGSMPTARSWSSRHRSPGRSVAWGGVMGVGEGGHTLHIEGTDPILSGLFERSSHAGRAG
jgi:hypothetical protein